MNTTTYHPDPEINALIAAEALENEKADLASGLPPAKWTCPDCATSHKRGHFGTIGSHRCMKCGYVGGGGIIGHEGEFDSIHPPQPKEAA